MLESIFFSCFVRSPTANTILHLCVSAIDIKNEGPVGVYMLSHRPVNKYHPCFDFGPQPDFCMRLQEAGNKKTLEIK